MKKTELLAPVGSKESLIAAIEAGCDAVYLGGTFFGARKFASNFNETEMKEAVLYAHQYGVKVYVTANTLIYENEIEGFLKYMEFLQKINVDAVIMQDIGMMDKVRKTYPNLSIHASTQMHIHNLEGAKLLEKLGLERTVLARETDIETIKKIRENTNIQLEIFVHGALCMCYSGQCLMSSLIGGRSGNRGTCTQCCRLPYDFYSGNHKVNKDSYLLSTKDLNTLSHLNELLDLNIDSLKIEGRMKSPEYVYQVVHIYRMAIDAYYEKKKIDLTEEVRKLQIIFNRKFTKGFLFHEENNQFINPYRPNHMGVEIGKVISYQNGFATILLSESLNRLDGIRIVGKEDIGFTVLKMFFHKKEVQKGKKGDTISIKVDQKVGIGDIVLKTKDVELIEEIHEKIKQRNRKVKLIGKLIAKKNEPLKLIVDWNQQKIEIEGDLVEESVNYPTTEQDLSHSLSKLGNTVFTFEKLFIEKDENIFVRVFSVNEMRRKMVDQLLEMSNLSKPLLKKEYKITLREEIEEPGFSVLVTSQKDYEAVKNKKIKSIYLNKDLYYSIEDDRKVLKLGRVISNYNTLHLDALIGELGGLESYPNCITDFSLNVVNSYSVAFLQSMGARRITLSYELNDNQIEDLINGYKNRYHIKPNLEWIVSSVPEVMISKFNLLKYFDVKNENNYLKDGHGNKFPVKQEDDKMIIQHYKKIKLLDYQKYFDMGIQTLRIQIEDKEDYSF